MTVKNMNQTQQFKFDPDYNNNRKDLVVTANNGNSPNGKRSTSVKNANQTGQY